MGTGWSYTHVVVPPATRRDTRPPLATTVYRLGAVTAIRYVALSAGRSLHGNQDGAPTGWLATSAPSVSSSQPMSPQRLRTGRGLPAYSTVTTNGVPAGTGRTGRTRSFPSRCRCRAGAPSRRTRSARNAAKSSGTSASRRSATAAMTARPDSRAVSGRYCTARS